MQPTQKLTNALRALLALVEEECSRNPDFARRLEAIVTDLPAVSGGKRPKRSKPAKSAGPLPDVTAAYELKGENEFRFWLREFDLPMLKSIVKANGFDPGKNSQRWTETDKFVALIADQTAARLRRGSAFLTPKSTESSSANQPPA
jgi:hypothetical protein